MDNDIAIKISHVSKIYEMYDKPIDRLKEALSFGRRNYHKDFYALNDINLEIKKGETVGIIGKNGAGKSTLLKIITGVLTPTCGEVQINGKISSLLELGAGFNPDFTGIENVYLNGFIMGYTKEEMDERLQSILDFADIGDFVYQPVKTYSSGMYVRLAFSVAINVAPDILIVDEALAVGDARFQLKCFQRLDQLKSKGTTIMFVSHAMDQVKDICQRATLLDDGKAIYTGNPKEAAVKYFQLIFPEQVEENDNVKVETEELIKEENVIEEQNDIMLLYPEQLVNKNQNFGNGGAKIDWMKIYGLQQGKFFQGGDEIKIITQYSWNQDEVAVKVIENNLVNDIGLGIALADKKGNYVFGCNNYDAGIPIDYKTNTTAIISLEFKMPYLASGNYFLTAAISVGKQENHVQLKWYDYFTTIECITCKKNVYGFMHLDYTMKQIL
ncbi:MAG: ABC transporter ATP-binding protein [Selenomonadaceae bacterium]|nr:ABC transporter ATP-binding protein [Selenomonadaceae bacterium]